MGRSHRQENSIVMHGKRCKREVGGQHEEERAVFYR